MVLIVQTTALVLSMRYTRTVATDEMYRPSTAVVAAEMIKIVVCIGVLYSQLNYSFTQTLIKIKMSLIDNWRDCCQVAVPAGLYAVQNNLLYLALSNLDPATYQVLYQLKVMTTALFSVLLLGKRLRNTQWLSLVMLMAGVCLVQLQLAQANRSAVDSDISEVHIALFLLCRIQ